MWYLIIGQGLLQFHQNRYKNSLQNQAGVWTLTCFVYVHPPAPTEINLHTTKTI